MFRDRCRSFRGPVALAVIFLGMRATVRADDLYFPPLDSRIAWETTNPADAKFDRSKLDEILDFVRRQRSSGFVILYRGRILAEGNWNPDDLPADAGQKAKGKAKLRGYEQRVIGRDAAGRAIEDVASAQKSVSAILAGLAQERGLLKITDPVQKYLGSGWSKASPEQEAVITIRHLLTMTSGLDDDLEFEAPPGKSWYYNSSAYSRVLMCAAAAARMDRNDLTKQWLTGPIGMQDSRWEERPIPAGIEVRNAVGFTTTARDLARFGLLIQSNGDWNGGAIIKDKKYLHDVLHPSQNLNPSYGYLWWLNGQSRVMRGRELVQGPLIPTAPPDLVAALGALQRKVYVVPSEKLVVTRIGDNCPPPDAELWRLIASAKTNQ